MVSNDPSELRRAVVESESVMVLTGAGISAESGIPTFRGPNGLWRNYSPEQLATREAFERDPRLVWEWYDWRRGIIRKASPNRGHLALAELERRKKEGGGSFTLVTQNVDGLHDRAGSQNILKLHGDIWMTRCVGCDRVEKNEEVPLSELPPRCECGALLRPAVVWFGEPLPRETWKQASDAALNSKVFLVVGTSALVYPAASLAEMARQKGARVAILNPEPTLLDRLAEWILRGTSGDLLPRLL